MRRTPASRRTTSMSYAENSRVVPQDFDVLRRELPSRAAPLRCPTRRAPQSCRTAPTSYAESSRVVPHGSDVVHEQLASRAVRLRCRTRTTGESCRTAARQVMIELMASLERGEQRVTHAAPLRQHDVALLQPARRAGQRTAAPLGRCPIVQHLDPSEPDAGCTTRSLSSGARFTRSYGNEAVR